MDVFKYFKLLLGFKENNMTKTYARRFIEEWFDGLYHQRRSEIIEERFHKNGIAYGIGGKQLKGPNGFRSFYEPFIAAYPKIRIDIEDLVVTGKRVAVRCKANIENTSGQNGMLEGMAFVTIDNGQMTEAWNSWDFMTLFTQMGLLPEDAFVKGVQGQKII